MGSSYVTNGVSNVRPAGSQGYTVSSLSNISYNSVITVSGMSTTGMNMRVTPVGYASPVPDDIDAAVNGTSQNGNGNNSGNTVRMPIGDRLDSLFGLGQPEQSDDDQDDDDQTGDEQQPSGEEQQPEYVPGPTVEDWTQQPSQTTETQQPETVTPQPDVTIPDVEVPQPEVVTEEDVSVEQSEYYDGSMVFNVRIEFVMQSDPNNSEYNASLGTLFESNSPSSLSGLQVGATINGAGSQNESEVPVDNGVATDGQVDVVLNNNEDNQG